MKRYEQKLKTSLFTKTTASQPLNYKKTCPEEYLKSAITSQLYRAFNVSCAWDDFDRQVSRLRQLFTNNGYPASVIDSVINKFVTSKVKPSNNSPKCENIKLFYRNRMSNNYKVEENSIKKIVLSNVKSVDSSKSVSLNIFYRNKKLSNLLIRNNCNREPDVGDHVVYKYSCPHGGCKVSNQQYVGFTMCSLKKRFSGHSQSGSIKEHLLINHPEVRIKTSHLLQDVSILYRSRQKYDLLLAEALYIKKLKPRINQQHEFSGGVLKIF